MKTLTLITGGIRSGKSAYALELAEQRSADQKCFIATAEALDAEMKRRIERHQAERGADFYTIEEPLKLGEAVQKAERFPIILIDCITLWLNNLFFKYQDDRIIRLQIDHFLQTLERRASGILIVTNEIGLGGISENPLARRFADELGFLNRRLAQTADEVYFMVSGIPQCLKGVSLGKLDL